MTIDQERKEVAYAYPHSPDAIRFCWPATGCWTVSTGKAFTLRARKAFGTFDEAQAYADTLNLPWSNYTMRKPVR